MCLVGLLVLFFLVFELDDLKINVTFTRLLNRLKGKYFLIICTNIFCLLTPLLLLVITIAMITILTNFVETLFLLNIFLFFVRLFLCQMPVVTFIQGCVSAPGLILIFLSVPGLIGFCFSAIYVFGCLLRN